MVLTNTQIDPNLLSEEPQRMQALLPQGVQAFGATSTIGGCISERSTWTLFEEPYWLDAVAPGTWEAVEIFRDGKVIARLPYVVRRNLGLTALTLPPLTPWLGPWIAAMRGKPDRQLGAEHDLLQQLVARLPRAQKIVIGCAPEFTNLHALHGQGFSLGLSYTYRLEDLSDLDQIWNNISTSTRKHCRKARNQVNVVTEGDLLHDVIHCVSKTFDRIGLGHRMSSQAAVLKRIDSVMGPRGQRQSFIAIDAKGRRHAALYLVWDDRHAFTIAGGSDKDLRSSGADSLLLWEAIKFSAARTRVFDFDGSMLPGVERINRSFGSSQTPRYSAVRQSMLLACTDQLTSRLTRLAGAGRA